jgi:hypothetical protein
MFTKYGIKFDTFTQRIDPEVIVFKKKSIRILIAMMFALLVPATLVLAASPPPPPSPTPVGTPAPTPQKKGNAPTAGQNCITNYLGPGTYNFQGTVNGVPHDVYFAGVIYVNLVDETVGQAFCIDLLHDTSFGYCYVAGENPEPHVNWLMQNYPPDDKLSNEENGARQVAVWYFSDGFTITAASNIFTRTSTIIASVPANPAPNPDVPTLRIAAQSITLPTGQSYTFTLTALRGSNPITGQVIALTTDFGTLSTNQVTTGANGTATFSISNSPNVTGTAHINASYTTQIPAGTVQDGVSPIDKLPTQRIMVGSSVNGPVVTKATTVWADVPTPILVATIEGYSGGPDLTQVAVGVGMLGFVVLGGVGWLATKRRNR